MTKKAIVIDCDPGVDDAIAILLALASPDEIDLLAITTVAGNVGLEQTAANAMRVLERAGDAATPVHAGCPRPILFAHEAAERSIHGGDGLGGAALPPPERALDPEHGVDAIVRILRERPEKSVTLAALGPLTNVALAFVKAPDVVPRIEKIVLMGGAIGLGNMTPAAEFNIYVDPHAARIVFEAGAPIVMLGLDVTHQALAKERHLNALRAMATPVGGAAAAMLELYGRYDRARYDEPAAPLHDPCVIAYLIEPSLFQGRSCHVEIGLDGADRGRTHVDWWGRFSERAQNALVVDRIDEKRFFDMVLTRLAKL